ncbi:ABC-type transport system involved in multi-copper enzyme maturation, permease component [Micromonospora nigra]|uniref:ABC-type transport system involved in multi-copper enzyme maturation, permease component n=1 Tax=Micromonospora nigra TaxID=145857 RepID=A0A1C6RU55_9ACTN|nr:ABC transporter permease subunit [Micromonospora nigra]SCL20751.1 ABC-type transport system involved in multi-copper enzyme maturation, permease component [Micromonospora nigra]
MSLFRTELRRLAKRRFARFATLAGLLVLAAVLAGMFFTNQKIDAAQLAKAERAAEAEYQSQLRYVEQHRTECEQAKAAGTADEQRFPADCADITPAPRESFQAEWHLPPTFVFRDGFGEMVIPFAAIMALIGFVVGASFVGAEWSTGGMMNLLLWRPKRLTVLLTKLGALLTGLLAVALPTAVLWAAGFWLVATFRGSTEGVTSGAWQSFALTGLRGVTLALVAAIIGFALASLGRHTAMALGGAIGVMIVGQVGLGILLGMSGVRFPEAWLLPTYVYAWMAKKVELQDWDACNVSYTGECQPDVLEITWQQSSVLFAVAVTVILGAAMWFMRRRDIT